MNENMCPPLVKRPTCLTKQKHQLINLIIMTVKVLSNIFSFFIAIIIVADHDSILLIATALYDNCTTQNHMYFSMRKCEFYHSY